MQQAFDEKRYMDLSLLSHRILPNMRSLGVTTAAHALKNIELLCKAEKVDDLIVKDFLEKAIIEMMLVKDKIVNISATAE